MALVATVGLAGGAPAAAGETGSRILDSPSRDVIHRNEPAPRSIVPGGNRTTPPRLSGRTGDPAASGGLGPARQAPTNNRLPQPVRPAPTPPPPPPPPPHPP